MMKVHSYRLLLAMLLSAAALLSQESVSSDPGHIAVPEDVRRGETIFEDKGGCLACHGVGMHGSLVGPDLSNIGAQLMPEQLRDALLSPAREVRPQYRRYLAVTRGGEKIVGKLLNQDRSSLQMLDTRGRLVSLDKSNLRDYDFAVTEPMPSYKDKLNDQEMRDLIVFLSSLKGVRPSR
jgi:putative heme-binding domain-containing protein